MLRHKYCGARDRNLSGSSVLASGLYAAYVADIISIY
jgi:hypothetical protein